DLTVSLPDGLTTLDGIHLQLTPASLVCPNVQISGIDANNITLQVTHLPMKPVFLSMCADLNQVMSNAGLVAGSNSSQEITLTINNSSLSQAIAQVQAQASAAGSSAAPGNTQEITLTISGTDSLLQVH
ncbi:hypothetical protein XENOCAPTIV_006256, partial [Xenoophorus captivus]